MARPWQNFADRRGIKDMLKLVSSTGSQTYEELVSHFEGLGVEPPPFDVVKDAFDTLFPAPAIDSQKKTAKKETNETVQGQDPTST
jgi:hypothetical protein